MPWYLIQTRTIARSMRLVLLQLLLFCVLALANIQRSSIPVSLVFRASPTSVDGNCGSNSQRNATCLTSTYGNCCSSKGFCGAEIAYCGEGCQPEFGTCLSSVPGSQVVSASGSCGATSTSNITCQGSSFGDCCSPRGFCGNDDDYCGSGCQTLFGTCYESTDTTSSSSSSSTPSRASSVGPVNTAVSTTSSTPSSAPIATAVGPASVDGNCGSNSATIATCFGSEFGDCCSGAGFCGGNSSYCFSGCQLLYGLCGSSAQSSSQLAATSSGSLSTGAKAGIAIAAVIIGIALIGLATWFLIRRRRNANKSGAFELGDLHEDGSQHHFITQDPSGGPMPVAPAPTLASQDQDFGKGTQLHEIGVYEKKQYAELGDNNGPVEMSAETAWSRKEEQERENARQNKSPASHI
ncbi:hypothetical protein B0O99DRAFT_644390 [Bisporella sp. PMI_857]|nr:hypothetical protein B0O99DRAFT_644390 [Bisporella sp. PMI_857]